MNYKYIVSIFIIFGMLAGCASGPERRDAIVSDFAKTIQPTQEKLSVFSDFEISSLKIAEAIEADEAKRIYAVDLDKQLTLHIKALFQEWKEAGNNTNRKLVVEPELTSLRIVSGSARFWAGGFAGNSSIQLKLILKDAETQSIIASPVISKEANGIAGAWSIGESDQNLIGYVVSIAEQYLRNNY